MSFNWYHPLEFPWSQIPEFQSKEDSKEKNTLENAPIIISFDGNIGSGKSSIVK